MNREDKACPICAGTGNDTRHSWTDGTPAGCEYCFGYGMLPADAEMPDHEVPLDDDDSDDGVDGRER